jgi:hypothetical protein
MVVPIDPAWAVSASQRRESHAAHYKVRLDVSKFAQAGSIIPIHDSWRQPYKLGFTDMLMIGCR